MPRTPSPGEGLPSDIQGAAFLAADTRIQQLGGSGRIAGEIADYQTSSVIGKARGLDVGRSESQNFLENEPTWDDINILRSLNLAYSNNPNPSGGLAGAQQAVFGASTNKDLLNVYQMGYGGVSPIRGFQTAYFAGQYYDPQNSPYNTGEDAKQGVALSDVPTSSSNYKRPRTVAAGYDVDSGTLTVVFRDGTFWNYYNISPGTWIIFHDSFTKGPLLNDSLHNKGRGDGLLLAQCSHHGPADMSNLSAAAQEFIYKIARTAQITYNLKRGRTVKPPKRQGEMKAKRQGNPVKMQNTAPKQYKPPRNTKRR
jgi:hypothetical protein